MKKLSKITAVLIAAMMCVLSFNVSAAVIEEVASETLLDVDFAGKSALPSGWEIKKNGSNMTTYFNALGLTTGDSSAATPTIKNGNLWVGYNNEFNSNGSAYSANIKFSALGQGSMVFVVGGKENWSKDLSGTQSPSGSSAPLTGTANGSYVIQLNHRTCNDHVVLYKNGTPIITKDVLADLKKSDNTTMPNVGSVVSWDITLNVKSDKVILDVSGSSKYSTWSGSFEADETSPIYNGYAGVYFAGTAGSTDGTKGTVYSIFMETVGSTKSTDNFHFNKQFGASDATDVTESLGFVEGSYDVTATADGLKLLQSGVSVSTLILDEYSFNGNYTISSSVNFKQNYLGYYINYQDDKNYYRLECGKVPKTGSSELVYGYILRKCVDGTISDLAIKDFTDANKYVFMNDNTPMVIKVKNEADKVTISAVGYKNGTAFESGDFVDNTETRISNGKFGFRAGSSGDTYLKVLKIYSAEPTLTVEGEDIKLSVPYMPWSSDASKVITAVYKNDVTKEIVADGLNIKSLSDFASGVVNVAQSKYNTEEYIVRAFIWDSLDTMKPLTTPVVLGK